MARLYQQKEDLEKSIEYGLKSEKLAQETSNYEWQARANGHLAGQYRMMGLHENAKIYSNKALEIIPLIKNQEKANTTAGLMQQELAFCSMEVDNYKQALRHLGEAKKHFSRVKTNKDFQIMSNERLIGLNYYYLKDYDRAIAHYNIALHLSTSQPTHYLTGMIYKGLAESLLEKGDLEEAKSYLDRAEKIADESQYLQLKEAVYTISKRYYAHVNDQKKLAIAQEKNLLVTEELLEKRAALLDKTYNKLEERGLKAESKSYTKSFIILAVLILLIFTIVFFILYRKKNQEELKKFKSILEELHKKNEVESAAQLKIRSNIRILPSNEPPPHEETETIDTPDRIVMNVETERKLLAGLEDFEKSGLFLEKSISLSTIASEMNSNTKYISYLIKTYKDKDFSNYINELRINYVIEKLKNNAKWRQYKISALAEMAGFSSHSQFASIFKNLKGLSPSAFIRFLNENNKK